MVTPTFDCTPERVSAERTLHLFCNVQAGRRASNFFTNNRTYDCRRFTDLCSRVVPSNHGSLPRATLIGFALPGQRQ